MALESACQLRALHTSQVLTGRRSLPTTGLRVTLGGFGEDDESGEIGARATLRVMVAFRRVGRYWLVGEGSRDHLASLPLAIK